VTSRQEEIEHRAELDLARTGQDVPPFRPSVVLRDLYGVTTKVGDVRGGTTQAVLIPGAEPRVVVSSIVGTAQARIRVAHEAGHAALEHIIPTALFQPPVGFRGHTLPKEKEAEADFYSLALTMPRSELEAALADGPEPLRRLAAIFDVPEADLRRRLRALDLWRLVYDDRNHRAYIGSGWWRETRRPAFLASLAHRQGRPTALCERCCRRQATVVHHLHYETLGCEADEDLEGLCSQCNADMHVGRG
jgi:IrrE N-terminal-like domain